MILFLANVHASMISFHDAIKGKWPKVTNAHGNMINALIKCKEKGYHTQERVATPNQQLSSCSKHKQENHKNMIVSSTLLTQAGNINLPRQKR